MSLSVRMAHIKKLCAELFAIGTTHDVTVRVTDGADDVTVVVKLHNSRAEAKLELSAPVSWSYASDAIQWTLKWITRNKVRVDDFPVCFNSLRRFPPLPLPSMLLEWPCDADQSAASFIV